jgi:hypothetical protein
MYFSLYVWLIQISFFFFIEKENDSSAWHGNRSICFTTGTVGNGSVSKRPAFKDSFRCSFYFFPAKVVMMDVSIIRLGVLRSRLIWSSCAVGSGNTVSVERMNKYGVAIFLLFAAFKLVLIRGIVFRILLVTVSVIQTGQGFNPEHSITDESLVIRLT